MNSRGQAALEYLMTYGWALVIIVVVAGILFFIMSSPSGGVVCQSSDPTKWTVSKYNIASSGPIEATLQNGTAGAITLTNTVTGTSSMGAVTATVASGGNVPAGNVINLQRLCGSQIASVCAAGSAYLGTATIKYKDQFGYAKTVVVTCQGTAR
jgi:hypothetical protein